MLLSGWISLLLILTTPSYSQGTSPAITCAQTHTPQVFSQSKAQVYTSRLNLLKVSLYLEDLHSYGVRTPATWDTLRNYISNNRKYFTTPYNTSVLHSCQISAGFPPQLLTLTEIPDTQSIFISDTKLIYTNESIVLYNENTPRELVESQKEIWQEYATYKGLVLEWPATSYPEGTVMYLVIRAGLMSFHPEQNLSGIQAPVLCQALLAATQEMRVIQGVTNNFDLYSQQTFLSIKGYISMVFHNIVTGLAPPTTIHSACVSLREMSQLYDNTTLTKEIGILAGILFQEIKHNCSIQTKWHTYDASMSGCHLSTEALQDHKSAFQLATKMLITNYLGPAKTQDISCPNREKRDVFKAIAALISNSDTDYIENRLKQSTSVLQVFRNAITSLVQNQNILQTSLTTQSQQENDLILALKDTQLDEKRIDTLIKQLRNMVMSQNLVIARDIGSIQRIFSFLHIVAVLKQELAVLNQLVLTSHMAPSNPFKTWFILKAEGLFTASQEPNLQQGTRLQTTFIGSLP